MAEIAPEIKMESPTTTNMSSGFHMLEIHGGTMSLMVVLLILLGVWALTTWRAMSWKRKRATKREAKIRDEMADAMEMGYVPELPTRMGNPRAHSHQQPTFPGRPRPIQGFQLGNQEDHLRVLLPIVSALATQAQAREDLTRTQGRITELPTAQSGPNRGPQRQKRATRANRDWESAQSDAEEIFNPAGPR